MEGERRYGLELVGAVELPDAPRIPTSTVIIQPCNYQGAIRDKIRFYS